MWLVAGQVLKLSAFGLVLGVGLLAAASRVIAQLLVGVRPLDPLTIGLVAGILGGAAAVAAWAPVSRASRVDPIEALRYE